MIQAVKTYLAGAGAPLLAFERATASMSAGHVPSHRQCLQYRDTILPRISPGIEHLRATASAVPDKSLAFDFQHDVGQKFVVLLACAKLKKTLPERVMPHTVYVFKILQHRLAAYGISI